VLAGVAVIFFVFMVFINRFTARSPVVRQQARTELWGMVIAFGPLAGWFLLTSLPSNLVPFPKVYNFPPSLLLFTIIFPLVTGYSILRYRLLKTDFLLRQAVLYALLSILALSGYALMVSDWCWSSGKPSVDNPFYRCAGFPLALGLTLRNRLQLVDAVSFAVRAMNKAS
jgi:hypothetical protein